MDSSLQTPLPTILVVQIVIQACRQVPSTLHRHWIGSMRDRTSRRLKLLCGNGWLPQAVVQAQIDDADEGPDVLGGARRRMHRLECLSHLWRPLVACGAVFGDLHGAMKESECLLDFCASVRRVEATIEQAGHGVAIGVDSNGGGST